MDNSGVGNLTKTTSVNITGAHLFLSNDTQSTHANFNIIDITGAQTDAVLNVDNTTVHAGIMYNHPLVIPTCSKILLSNGKWEDGRDLRKFIETTPVADLTYKKNTWVKNSGNTDPDLVSAALSVVSGNATVTVDSAVTYDNGKSTKVVIPAAETGQVILEHTPSILPAITVQGQSILWFLRTKFSGSVPIEFAPYGNQGDYDAVPYITSKHDEWIDYVLKTDSDVEWNLGRQANPKFRIKITNNTGEDLEFHLDRIDYRKVQGDIFLK